MKPLYLLLTTMCLMACAKEKPAATVTLEANCFRCAIEESHNGTVWRDSIGNVPADSLLTISNVISREFAALVGDEVSISAHALDGLGGFSVVVSAKVNGHVHGFEFIDPQTEDSSSTVMVRFVVPELDRFGNPK